MNVHVPVKTDGLTAITSGYEPVVRDRSTGEVATDRETGKTMYRVHLTVVLPGEVPPQVWSVRVIGEPKGLVAGQVVTMSGLVASEWEMEGRHGIGFRADSVVATGAGAAKPAAA
jgi:hypothetical protein